MKKLEIIFIIFALVGVAMKLLYIPLAGFTITISFTGLAIIYFLSVPNNRIVVPSIFYDKETYNELKPLGVFGLRIFGWSLSTVLIGILFTLQFWKNGRFFLVLGLISLFLGLLLSVKEFRSAIPDLYTKMIRRIVVIGGLGLMIFMTRPIILFEIFHRDNPALVESARNYWADPGNKELKAEYERQRKLTSSQ